MMEIYDYLPDFAIPRTTDIHVGTTVQQLCPADPTRWYLAFSNIGSLAVYSGVSPQVAGTGGVNLFMPTTGTYQMYWKHHGLLVTMAWYGVTVGPTGTVTVTELFWRPQGV